MILSLVVWLIRYILVHHYHVKLNNGDLDSFFAKITHGALNILFLLLIIASLIYFVGYFTELLLYEVLRSPSPFTFNYCIYLSSNLIVPIFNLRLFLIVFRLFLCSSLSDFYNSISKLFVSSVWLSIALAAFLVVTPSLLGDLSSLLFGGEGDSSSGGGGNGGSSNTGGNNYPGPYNNQQQFVEPTRLHHEDGSDEDTVKTKVTGQQRSFGTNETVYSKKHCEEHTLTPQECNEAAARYKASGHSNYYVQYAPQAGAYRVYSGNITPSPVKPTTHFIEALEKVSLQQARSMNSPLINQILSGKPGAS